MEANGGSSSFWSWLYIAVGSAIALITLKQAYQSLAAGSLQFSSSKYGFTVYGAEAAIIYIALLLASFLIIGIGWRGLRHDRRDT